MIQNIYSAYQKFCPIKILNRDLMKCKNERNDRHPRSYPYAIYVRDLASPDLDTNLILPISPPHDR